MYLYTHREEKQECKAHISIHLSCLTGIHRASFHFLTRNWTITGQDYGPIDTLIIFFHVSASLYPAQIFTHYSDCILVSEALHQ